MQPDHCLSYTPLRQLSGKEIFFVRCKLAGHFIDNLATRCDFIRLSLLKETKVAGDIMIVGADKPART
jgi:hypothetical protein